MPETGKGVREAPQETVYDGPGEFDRPATNAAHLVVDGGRAPHHSGPRTVTVPGDKSVSHRALLAALLPGAPAHLTVRNANLGGAVRALLPALHALGLRVDDVDDDGGGTLVVRRGAAPVPQQVRDHPHRISWPADVPYLETGGSSAAARLLIGMLAGTGTRAVVDGDDVLRHRPMEWIVDPLRQLGAVIDYLGERGRLPVVVREPVCRPGTVELTVGSAQARSAVLLAVAAAGLAATVRHPVRSRDHTERMLAAFGGGLDEHGRTLTWDGGPYTVPPVIDVPADPSLAAYPVAAHLLWGDGSELRVPGVGLNPTRLGFFEVLRRAGAGISYEDERSTSGGEPTGTVVARGGLDGLESVRVDEPAVLHALIDEVPLLAAVAARLPGTSWIGCAEELRFKETDRLTTTARMVAAFGARVEVAADGLTVTGGAPLRAGTVPGFEDHRIAMAAATLATSLPGRTTVHGGACHHTSFPDFADVQRAVGARIVEDSQQ
ncbi:3-phosphoshikimate 1-carboxyvinyltransferase [Streptomyces noursei]|uniref:3-phosphoshikimate 1-carboxyvinyltransferase n=1 Tax=Streptomyces noursei TaxID=1971 RepID=A0A059VNI9_STRNR|nr:3-phosphoshikimate 1-carboxyvinyltransferase [Streptomyces noursei]AIA00929.1 prephenate dehydrogenase/3-phosphoshikimate 1-carboxyvinyltransferase [Streptomyces noursei]UWS69910.1 3-phosphoshikimate 1-carboxyvinyltransferase [Streptomyces noursei]GCB88535.1 3-phosphoshikimate 1-carboxyvinyltransferase [Streptomyces noursei]